jgi:hypothetical protein
MDRASGTGRSAKAWCAGVDDRYVTLLRPLAVALSSVLLAAAPAHAAHLLDTGDRVDKQATKADSQDDASATPTPKPTSTPKPTPTPKPTSTPKPTPTPKPAKGQGDDANSSTGDDASTGDGSAPALAPAAPPVAGTSVTADVTSGAVTVKVPGTDAYVPLDQAASMPVGSVIDARDGAVSLQAALPGVGTETGTFSGSRFIVHQDTRRHLTELRLTGGDFGKCEDRRLAAAGKHSKTVIRSLWGTDHGGHFRTHGHNSVATVRGTQWLTEDRCDGTLTEVTQGAVSVYDRRAHRTVVVRAGHSYLALRHP